MAYHGYIPHIKSKLAQIKEPRVLEIGLDTGITTIPLVVFLTRVHEKFDFVGVDVLIKDSLAITLSNIDTGPAQNVMLFKGNSLEMLPALAAKGEKFDVVLVDGDHNYHTVSQEMQYLDALLKPGGIVVVDDYHGKWSEDDLFYATRPGYEGVEGVTQPVATEKKGVRPAVDEFLEAHPDWETQVLMQGEPILLRRRELSVFGKSVFSL